MIGVKGEKFAGTEMKCGGHMQNIKRSVTPVMVWLALRRLASMSTLARLQVGKAK